MEISTVPQLQALLAQHRVIIIDFHASWCGPCKVAMPHFTRLAQEYPSVLFGKINLDTADSELISHFQVTSIPLFVIIAQGQVVERIQAYQEEKIRACLNIYTS